jgi:hypothetical protein
MRNKYSETVMKYEINENHGVYFGSKELTTTITIWIRKDVSL